MAQTLTPTVNIATPTPKEALLLSFCSYWNTKTGKTITPIIIGDWAPTEQSLTTVQCVSSSLVSIDRTGYYLTLALLVRKIELSETIDENDFNIIFKELSKDKKILYDGKAFNYVSGEFNSPIRVNGGSALEGFYDSGLLESENVLTTSALFTFNIYE